MPVSKHRKKRGKKKRKQTARRKQAPSSNPPSPLPDRRMMEKPMAMLSATASATNTRDALHRAQELIYDAWETKTARKRIQLAKRALRISDLCADAHSLLAEDAARTLVEKRAHCERALAAGEKAVGPQTFKDSVGHFWGILDTRPYMRARSALADCLWECGERAAAIGHLQDMLRLNPNDNQGVRYLLTGWLLSVRDHDALEKLLQAYRGDSSANWGYSGTLLAFRRADEPGSSRSLANAWQQNSYVPALLIGWAAIPGQVPDYYSPGGRDEAILYVLENRENWAATEGALPWLARAVQDRPPPKED